MTPQTSLNSIPQARTCYINHFKEFPIPEKGDSVIESNRKFTEGRTKLLNIFKKNFPKEIQAYIDGLFQENSSVSFCNNLLLYAKKLPLDSVNDTKLKITDFALQFFKFSELFGFMESKRPFDLDALDEKLTNLHFDTFKSAPSPYIKWKISIDQLLKIARISLSKNASEQEWINYATSLRSLINIYLEKGPFNHLATMLFDKNVEKTLEGKQVGSFPSLTGVKHTNQGILLVCFPQRWAIKATYDYGTAYKAFEMFIPFDATPSQEFPIRQVQLFIGKREKRSELFQEQDNWEKLSRLPSNAKAWPPSLTLYAKDTFTKNEGIESLSLEKKNGFSCLSTLDLLEICDNIADHIQRLIDSDLVHLSIEPNSIFFNKKHLEKAKGFLHTMISLTKAKINLPPIAPIPWLNALAQKGHFSSETNCFSLVHLIDSLFLTDSLSDLQQKIPQTYYEKVLALKEQHRDSPEAFPKALLLYAARTSPSLEDKHFVTLRQFAFKTAIFPQLKTLIDDTLYADNQHKLELEKYPTPLSDENFSRILALEPKIPSLEKIQETLRNSMSKIQEMEHSALEKYSPKPHLSIDPSQIQEMLGHILLPQTSISEKNHYADLWLRSLNRCLKSSEWIEHNQIRLHKKLENLPFSYLVQKTEGGLWIKAFSRRFLANTEGSYKKVKFVLSFFLPEVKNPSTPLIPQSNVIYRIDDAAIDAVLSSYAIHQTLMQLEDSNSYFVPQARSCRNYPATRSWKWEWESPWYNGTLNHVIARGYVQDSMDSSKPIYINALELIESLIHTTLGIELLHSHGILHKDLKDENILIKINKEDLIKKERQLVISTTFPQKTAFLKNKIENLRSKKQQHIMTSIGSKVKKRELENIMSHLSFCENQLKKVEVTPLFKRIKALISDFDLTTSSARHNIQDNYYCWDYLCTRGFASKNTDYYSLTILIGDALIPGFFESDFGSNEKRKIFYASLLEQPEQKKQTLYQKKIQKLSSSLDEKGKALLRPFLHPNLDLSKERTELLMYAKELEKQGASLRPLQLKKFVAETLFFDKAFELVRKTFKADQRARTYMAAHQNPHRNFEEKSKAALEQARFPNIEEFKELLLHCKSVTESIESQYNDL